MRLNLMFVTAVCGFNISDKTEMDKEKAQNMRR